MTAQRPKLTQDIRPIILDTALFRGLDHSSVEMGLHFISEQITTNMQRHAKACKLEFELGVYCRRLTVSYLTPADNTVKHIRMDLPTLVLFSVCSAHKPELDSKFCLSPTAKRFFTRLTSSFWPLQESLSEAAHLVEQSPLANPLEQLAVTAVPEAQRRHRLLRQRFNAELSSVRQALFKPRVY